AAIRARQQDPDLRAVSRRVARSQWRNGMAAVRAGQAGEVQGRIARCLARTGRSCDTGTKNGSEAAACRGNAETIDGRMKSHPPARPIKPHAAYAAGTTGSLFHSPIGS